MDGSDAATTPGREDLEVDPEEEEEEDEEEEEEEEDDCADEEDELDIRAHEQRALNYLVNEYLLGHAYRLTAITFSEENTTEDFDDWDSIGINTAKPPNLLRSVGREGEEGPLFFSAHLLLFPIFTY